MERKTALAVVTGANQGLGFEIAKKLYRSNYEPLKGTAARADGLPLQVILACRNLERGNEAASKILAAVDAEFRGKVSTTNAIPPPSVLKVDLSDPASFEIFATDIKKLNNTIDILVNNAAILDNFSGGPLDRAQAEEILKINYTNTVAFTEAMLPLLTPSADTRVVVMSSRLGALHQVSNETFQNALKLGGNPPSKSQLENVRDQFIAAAADFSNPGNKSWFAGFAPAYCVSKALLNGYWRLQSAEHKATWLAACPGYCATNMTNGKGTTPADEGADTPAWLCLAPASKVKTGRFYAERQNCDYASGEKDQE